ncbi:MAG TPA: hypothetical protein VEL76_16555 [Gemmataceae bacterium]|nr:hypothetical protein [Gemmataceae bacterium]
MNLILAVCWLLVAVVLMVLSATSPDAPYARLGQTGLPTVIVPIFFFFYNLGRWWAVRAAERRRKLRQPPAHRRDRHEHDRARERPPDPNFDFTDQPPPPRPPSAEPRA